MLCWLSFLLGCCCFPFDWGSENPVAPPVVPPVAVPSDPPVDPAVDAVVASPAVPELGEWALPVSAGPLPHPKCAKMDAAFCSAMEISDVGTAADRIAAGVNPNCTCSYTYEVRKLSSYIPIVQDFVHDKYRSYTVTSTPLWMASAKGNAPLIQFLLSQRAHPDYPNPDGSRPLDAALGEEDQLRSLQLLVEAGANVKTLDIGPVDRVETAKRLIAMGASPKRLDATCLLSDPSEVSWFIAQHPDLSDERAEIVVGLEGAVLGALLDAGLSASLKTADKSSDLLLLSLDKNPDLVPILLKHGANPNSREVGIEGMSGETALCLATQSDQAASLVPLLIQAGAKLESPCVFGQTPLSGAAKSGHRDALLALIQAGAKINVSSGGLPLLQSLIDDITFFDDPSSQAFHKSAQIESVDILLQHGATLSVGGLDACGYARQKKAGPELLAAACR